MTFRCLTFLLMLMMAPAVSATALAQEVFEDPEGKYSLTLPAGWHAVVSRDGLGRTEVNIVYRVRENGSLKVKLADDYEPGTEISDYAKKDEQNTLRFQPGYDRISLENFVIGSGKTGILLSYDYKNTAGQPFTARHYYIRMDDKTLYSLSFKGRKNTLASLRNQTDAMARSFKIKVGS